MTEYTEPFSASFSDMVQGMHHGKVSPNNKDGTTIELNDERRVSAAFGAPEVRFQNKK